MKFDLVDKWSYLLEYHNAAFETIEAETRGKAKAIYHKIYPELEFIDILCRKSKPGSFNSIGLIANP